MTTTLRHTQIDAATSARPPTRPTDQEVSARLVVSGGAPSGSATARPRDRCGMTLCRLPISTTAIVPLTCTCRVEVSGLEPPTSTLRTSFVHPPEQGLRERTSWCRRWIPLRPPHLSSRSLTIRSFKITGVDSKTRPWRQASLVVIAGLEDDQVISFNQVDEPVLLINPPRPTALEHMTKLFRFPDPISRLA